jgi:uncharacterized delta-60 repeat protein
MTLITRQEKGSRLTIQEMDENLQTLKDLTTQEGDEIFVPEFKQATGIVGSGVNKSTVYPDKKIFIGGNFTQYGGIGGINLSINRVIRFMSDGKLDMEFCSNIGTGANAAVWNCQVLNDGRLLLTGIFTTFNNQVVNGIVCLNPNGTRDTSFQSGTGLSGTLSAIGMTYDKNTDKIYLAGLITAYNGTPVSNKMIRLNSNGTIDNEFNSSVTFSERPQMKVMPDGRVFVAGPISSGGLYNQTLMLNPDGSVDTSFTSIQVSYTIIGSNEPVIMDDGKIVFYGQISSPRSSIVVLNPDGTLYTDFDTLSGFTSSPPFRQDFAPTFISCVVKDGNKLLFGGTPNFYNNTLIPKIARLNMDGTLDTTFNVGTGLIEAGGVCDIFMNDQDFLVTGAFSQFNGRLIRNIVRLRRQI